jgi:putative GTP pyrophosphokinase
VHDVRSRLKARDSFDAKIRRSPGKYSDLSAVTDLVGLRIITYFAADVDRVASILEEEFEIDRLRSVDKRARTDPTQFGYSSLHYIISLPERRTSLSEYRGWRGLLAEVQVRSLLQHAWAEIEHDLGYKAVQDVPFDIRRRFARVAGLLELADEEFDAIHTRVRVEGTFGSEPTIIRDEAELTDDVLIRAITEDQEIVTLDRAVAGIQGAALGSVKDASALSKCVRAAHLRTVGDLRERVRQFGDVLPMFARELVTEKRDAVSAGYSLLLLCYCVAAAESTEATAAYLRQTQEGRPDAWYATTAEQIAAAYRRTIDVSQPAASE